MLNLVQLFSKYLSIGHLSNGYSTIPYDHCEVLVKKACNSKKNSKKDLQIFGELQRMLDRPGKLHNFVFDIDNLPLMLGFQYPNGHNTWMLMRRQIEHFRI